MKNQLCPPRLSRPEQSSVLGSKACLRTQSPMAVSLCKALCFDEVTAIRLN